jgi:hypothetical protein
MAMSRSTIPDYQKKQRVINVERSPAKDLIAYGDRCLETGRIFDALDFYQGAKHLPGLEKIKESAEASGDVMLFQQVMKAMGMTITADAWDAIGRKAMAQGKYTFSLHAFESSGNDALREEAGEIMRSNGQVSWQNGVTTKS